METIDTQILEAAIREISLSFDRFIGECADSEGKQKAPDRGAVMRAKASLPPYCKNALSKPTGKTTE